MGQEQMTDYERGIRDGVNLALKGFLPPEMLEATVNEIVESLTKKS